MNVKVIFNFTNLILLFEVRNITIYTIFREYNQSIKTLDFILLLYHEYKNNTSKK